MCHPSETTVDERTGIFCTDGAEEIGSGSEATAASTGLCTGEREELEIGSEASAAPTGCHTATGGLSSTRTVVIGGKETAGVAAR